MRLFVAALALVASAPAFAANGLCRDSYLPRFGAFDSMPAFRTKILAAGFFPVLATDPQGVPNGIRNAGMFEFSSCQRSSAFDGCLANWITRYGEKVLIAFPADGAPPFISDCPQSMREG